MLFRQFDFENAIIGYDFFKRPVYSFDRMVQCLVIDEHFSSEEARAYLENELESESFNDDCIVLYRFY